MTEPDLMPRNPMDRIPLLTHGELPGWWIAVCVAGLRPELPGERAALLERARVLGVVLP